MQTGQNPINQNNKGFPSISITHSYDLHEIHMNNWGIKHREPMRPYQSSKFVLTV